MAVQTTNTFTAVITSQEDSTGNVTINRGTGNPAVDSTSAMFSEQFKISGPNIDRALPVPRSDAAPANLIDHLYIKNNDAAAIVIVKWTPNGGAAATIVSLNPGAQIILWQSSTGKGVGAINVQSNVDGSFVEFFCGVI